MGEIKDIQIELADCSFCLTFAVVSELCHNLILGTSFFHESRAVIHFQREEPFMLVTDGKITCNVPVSYHRSNPSVKQLESDRRNWPSDGVNKQEERAQAPAVFATSALPHFSTVLANSACLGSACLTGVSTVASSSVELEIEEMVVAQDGDGPVAGLFPIQAETEERLPVVFAVEQALESDQQDKADWQILPKLFN